MVISGNVLAPWINLWSNRCGFSYNDTAAALNRSPGQTHHWYSGKHGIYLDNLVELICHFYEQKAIPEIGELRKALADFGVTIEAFQKAVQKGTRRQLGKRIAESLQEDSPFRLIGMSHEHRTIVERFDLLENIQSQLQSDDCQTVVLWGMGGIGKTTLAKQIAIAPDTQLNFWNGVLFASFGPEPDLKFWLELWARHLNLSLRTQDSLNQLWKHIHQHLVQPGKSYLLILDDVWDRETLNNLVGLNNSLYGKTLITTRKRELSLYIKDSCLVEISPMSEAEALELLRREAGNERITEDLIEYGPDLVRLLNCIPLAVSLLGRQIRTWGWDYMRPRVKEAATRLPSLTLDPSREEYLRHRDTSVRLMLELSYQSLPDALQCYFRRLSVFPYGCSFPVGVVLDLWELGAHYEDLREVIAVAENRLKFLHDQGLLEIVQVEADVIRYTLHTVVHDYASLMCASEEKNSIQHIYVDIYLSLMITFFPEIQQAPSNFRHDLRNIEQALKYALELGQQEKAVYLLSHFGPWLLVTARFGRYRHWLKILETQRDVLSEQAQGELDYAWASMLLAIGQQNEADRYVRQLLDNPQADRNRKAVVQHLQARTGASTERSVSLERIHHSIDARQAKQLQPDQLYLAAENAVQQEKWDEAWEFGLLLKQQAKQREDPQLMIHTDLLMANIHHGRGALKAARELLKTIASFARQRGQTAFEWTALLNLQPVLLDLKRSDEALETGKRLLSILDDMGLDREQTAARKSYLLQASVWAWLQKGDFKQAKLQAAKGLFQAHKSKDDDEITRAYMILAEVSKQQGDHKSAARTYLDAAEYYAAENKPKKAEQFRELAEL